MTTAICLVVFLIAMAGSAAGLLSVDRRTLRPVLTTSALIVAVSGYVALVFHWGLL
ncbi:hypothetical protein [Streptomyces sp. CA-111067]|uniref:hypothetical protein n=1 Tax=Streptomyces sp. CA-111067 TaxID=3240046 RepID=UPI003D97A03A